MVPLVHQREHWTKPPVHPFSCLFWDLGKGRPEARPLFFFSRSTFAGPRSTSLFWREKHQKRIETFHVVRGRKPRHGSAALVRACHTIVALVCDTFLAPPNTMLCVRTCVIHRRRSLRHFGSDTPRRCVIQHPPNCACHRGSAAGDDAQRRHPHAHDLKAIAIRWCWAPGPRALMGPSRTLRRIHLVSRHTTTPAR